MVLTPEGPKTKLKQKLFFLSFDTDSVSVEKKGWYVVNGAIRWLIFVKYIRAALYLCYFKNIKAGTNPEDN